MPAPRGVVLSTSCVPFVMLEIVVFGAMFAPMTACPAASPAVLGSVTVVVVVAAAVLRLTPRFSRLVATPTPPLTFSVPPVPCASVLKFSALLPPLFTMLITLCPLFTVSEPAWPDVPSVVPAAFPIRFSVPPLRVTG